jgi:hypothetical protein
MARYSLRRFGVNAAEAEAIAQGLRGRPFAPPTPPTPSRLDRIRARFARRAPEEVPVAAEVTPKPEIEG